MSKLRPAVRIEDLVPSVPKVQTLITSEPILLKYSLILLNILSLFSDSVSISISGRPGLFLCITLFLVDYIFNL